MPARTASIGARISLDATAFRNGLSSADSEARRFAHGLGGISNAQNRWTEFASKLQVAGAAFQGLNAVGKTAVSTFKSLFEAGAKLEDIFAGISAVAKGKESVADQLKGIEEASKLPGVGFQELAAGSIALQTLNIESKKSRTLLVELGNALAQAGKGKADLQAITDSLGGMFSNGKVDSDNIKEMAARAPQIKGIANSIQDLDKVKPSEFVDILIAGLAKLPRMASTAHAELDNMKDQFEQFKQKVGGELATDIGKGYYGGLSKGLENFDSEKPFSGIAGVVGETIKGTWGGFVTSAEKTGRGETMLDKYEVSPDERAKRQKAADEMELAMREARFQAAKKIFDQQKAELELQQRIAEAQADGDFERKRALEDQLVVLKDVKKVSEGLNITRDQATQLLQQQAAAQRALQKADPNSAMFRQKTQETEQVAQLRDRGRNRAANKLEESQTRDDRLRELQQNGFSEKDATTIADSEARRRRRQRHFERTGRRLIGGASTPDDHEYTIDNAISTENSFTNDYKFFPPRPTQDQTDKQSDREMFRQTGKLGGTSFSTPNSRLHPSGRSTRDDPKLTEASQSPPQPTSSPPSKPASAFPSTRDQDWSQVDGLNGNPPPPPRDRTIRGAGAKPKGEEPSASAAGGGGAGQSPFQQVHQLAQEISASLKTNNELLRQIAGGGSVASKTAPQSTR